MKNTIKNIKAGLLLSAMLTSFNVYGEEIACPKDFSNILNWNCVNNLANALVDSRNAEISTLQAAVNTSTTTQAALNAEISKLKPQELDARQLRRP
jgi:hypothetical protein